MFKKKQNHHKIVNEYFKILAKKFKSSSAIIRCRVVYETLTNSPNLKVINAQKTRSELSLEESIDAFSKRWPEIQSDSDSDPIFIFSAGWRSGSTLVQRLVCSSGKILIWGEPYGHSGLIDHLSRPIRAITEKYPRFDSFISSYGDSVPNLSNLWVANLYPDVQYLLQAQTQYIKQLFELPAKEKGALRWGIKEVRLTIDHAIYLNWLFPKAKFIFLYRNPYEAYASLCQFSKYNVWPYDYWYRSWPDSPIDSPIQFGEHWQHLLKGYLTDYTKVNSIIVKYEDLCEGHLDLEDLEDFLETPIDKNLLKKKIKGTTRKKATISSTQLKELETAVEPLASQLGYRFP